MGSTPGIDASGSMLWARAGNASVPEKDVDIAEVYDGWSILSLLWLEVARALSAGARRPRSLRAAPASPVDGELPVNTGGGRLSAGRLTATSSCTRPASSFRGGAGQHQVTPVPEVAVVSTGAGHFTGCMLVSTG